MSEKHSPGRRLGLALGLTGVLAGALVAGGGPASADPAVPVVPVVVRVPGHPVDSSLRLVGASGDGVAVVQGDDENFSGSRSQAPVLTGAEGEELTERPDVQPLRSYGDRLLLGVSGGQLGWAAEKEQYGERSAWEVHRTNILTGDDRIDGTTVRPAVFDGWSWLTTASLTRYPPSGAQLPLYRHRAGTGPGGKDGEMDAVKLLDHAEGVVDLASDGPTLVVAVADPPLPGPYEEDTAPSRTYRVQRFPNGSGPPETLAETTDVITSVAVAAGTVAWDSQAPGQSRRISTRVEGEDGPVVTSYTETGGAPDVDLVAGPGEAAYLVPADGAASALRIVHGESARTVALPAGSAGLAAVGDRFLTAAGGSSKVAGVYSVSPGDKAVRTATVPSAVQPVQDVALAGSSLYFTDSTPDTIGPRSIWTAAVTGRTDLKVAASKRLTVSGVPDAGSGPSWYRAGFSAGRGLVLAHDETSRWLLLDRGKVTGSIAQNEQYGADVRPTLSGPYALVDRNVVTPDGTEIYQVPEPFWFGLGQRALFGSTVVYSSYPEYPETEKGSEVWVDDVEDPEPQLLGNSQGCYPGAPVSVWGETVAWTSSCEAGTITVRNLRTGVQRTVNGGTQSLYAPAGALQLGEGVLFWTTWSEARDRYEGHVLDLVTPGATPVDLAGDWSESAFDDHLLARRTGPVGPIEVQRLPFEVPYRPRLIGKVAGASFRPAALWRPRFDITKPMVDVKLTIVDNAGQVVRTLPGTAPDGSIRDLVWDGRDRQGRLLAAGLYRWTLTGSAADGEGALLGKRGGGSVIGSVRITP